MSKAPVRMFISQDTLTLWLDSENVDLEDERLALSHLRASYTIEPACRFVSLLTDGDIATLEGKVLSVKRIEELGGELMEDSVVVGDHALEVENGFIGTLVTS